MEAGAGVFGTADQVWAAALVFARVGAIVMLIPGIGEQAVPPRVRLSFALLLAFAITPLVSAGLPALPPTMGGVVGHVIREVLIGLMLGGLLRILLSALSVAGELVSLQTTLSMAQTTNPLQAAPGSTIATFLGLFGLVLIFASDLHHLFLSGVLESYRLFEATEAAPVQDAAMLAARTTGQAFSLGVQMAGPVIVFALVFNVAVGLVGRVMPQFQVFFVAAPLQIMLGLAVFALTLGAAGLVWLDEYRVFLKAFG